MARALFTLLFKECKEEYRGIEKRVINKIRIICSNPLIGEPLKYQLAGFHSAPLVDNFILIYIYCRYCRIQGFQEIRKCPNCKETPDETIIFVLFGPHDEAYKKAKKINGIEGD